MNRISYANFWKANLKVLSPTRVSGTLYSPHAAPLECYIMQGQHPLPDLVIDKFTKTGGELCKNVFLLSNSLFPSLLELM